MSRLLVYLYEWFEKHRAVMYVSMVLLIGLCVAGASMVRLDEDISSFFGGGEEGETEVFDNFRQKDMVVVTFTGAGPDLMIEASEGFEELMTPLLESSVIASVTNGVDQGMLTAGTDFIYENLPLYLTEDDYLRIDSLLNEQSVQACVQDSYDLLTSMSGLAVRDVVLRDPLNVGTPQLRRWERFDNGAEYEVISGHLFSKDLGTMLMFIEPANDLGNTGANDELVTALEDASAKVTADTGVAVDFVGGPVIAVYNARQIKKDVAVTMSIALAVIILVITVAFSRKRSILLILLPPVFGALFALGCVGAFKGDMSAIAIGVGTVVMGIAMSYSIHVLSHSIHEKDPRKVIEDLAGPLTIGCLTTIGAFVALMFTSSPLLQDLGLFAALALVGTTVFSLIYLPHFLGSRRTGHTGRIMDFISRFNGYGFHGNRYILAGVVLLFVVCLFFYRDVKFDDDMSHINYIPERQVRAEQHLESIMGDQDAQIYLVTSAGSFDDALAEYMRLDSLCTSLQESGEIDSYTSVSDMVFTKDRQEESIERWNEFWASRSDETVRMLRSSAVKEGFRENAFAGFENLLTCSFEPYDYSSEEFKDIPLLSEWVVSTPTSTTLLSTITIQDQDKDAVYARIDALGNTAVVDRAWFASKMVTSASADFDYILLVSSLLVFLALLLSYGRLELALMTFLPMCVSWVIILGIMALADIRFNIVNIILATFIFGLGDDFSIFIMDGLIKEYKTSRKMLQMHKTAIFFSAFTAIVSMGAMSFASHPALKSIGLISVLGMLAVVVVAYTVQPVLFRLLVQKPTSRKGFPHTFFSLLNMVYVYSFFFVGCIFARIVMLLLTFVPVSKKKKKHFFRWLVHKITKLYVVAMFTVRKKRENPYNETFEKPSLVLANHSSFIDIILMLSLSPKLVMVTNSWVWKSPFFGRIVRYAGFFHSADGYESMTDGIREAVNDGYSVVIFPEGTRSEDCSIRRFHKGAFFLANELKLDIVPVVIYGAGMVSSKTQGFYIKRGLIMTRCMKRVPYGDKSFGDTYQAQARNYRQWYKEQYEKLCVRFNKVGNPYFRNALVKNYIYKDSSLEWYIRVKAKVDGYYDFWDKLTPRKGVITDVGCGYGQLCFMLGLLSPERRLYGVDYDDEKIAIAENSFLKSGNMSFSHGDMRICDLPQSDVFIFNDSLHYVDADAQEKVLVRCFSLLNPGGVVLVRDADAMDDEKHKAVKKIEVVSTRIVAMNKTEGDLSFVDREWMNRVAEENGMTIKSYECDRKTSERIYVLTKK